MKGCKNCPAYAKCTVTYRGSACAALRGTYGIDSDPEIAINADRIRAMSDEELAIKILRRWRAENEAGNFEDISTQWCDMKGGCISSKGYLRPCTEARILDCIKRWLQQPAEGEN